jgi:hypothetical protein
MEPMVCEPTAIGIWKSATAAAEPAEEPPGVREVLWAFLVAGPTNEEANSVVVVLPEKLSGKKTAGTVRVTYRK